MRIVVADAAVACKIGACILRIQPGQRAAVHCECGRRILVFRIYLDDAVLFAVRRKFNCDLAAALAVVQREVAVAKMDQVEKRGSLACVDRDLMAVQIQHLAIRHLNFFILAAQRIFDVLEQFDLHCNLRCEKGRKILIGLDAALWVICVTLRRARRHAQGGHEGEQHGQRQEQAGDLFSHVFLPPCWSLRPGVAGGVVHRVLWLCVGCVASLSQERTCRAVRSPRQ